MLLLKILLFSICIIIISHSITTIYVIAVSANCIVQWLHLFFVPCILFCWNPLFSRASLYVFFLLNDSLFILKSIAFGVGLIIDLGWLELILMSVGEWLFLLNGINVLLSKSNVMSRKFAIFRLEVISIFNPSKLKGLMIFSCIFDVLGTLPSGMKMRLSFLYNPTYFKSIILPV